MTRLIRAVILLALVTQVTHAAWVFNNISQTKGPLLDTVMSYVFAASLELSIFIFTIRGKVGIATFFAVVSTLINILYYWFEVGFSLQFCSMVVISPIIPTTIYFYSDLIMEDVMSVQKPLQKKESIRAPQAAVSAGEDLIDYRLPSATAQPAKRPVGRPRKVQQI